MEEQNKYILSLDIGTSNIRCYIFNKSANIIGRCCCPIKIIYPESQAVEIEPDGLWEQIKHVIQSAISDASVEVGSLVSMGISTQRGTFILWDKETGKPFHNFMVWQDTRAEALSTQWNEAISMRVLRVASRGLHVVTQYKKFLAAAVLRFRSQQVTMRLLWLFQKKPEIKHQAEQGKVRFGTLDTWVIWKLTNHQTFASEYSCASSTGIYDPYILDWSGFFCTVLGIPKAIFPPVFDTNADFGECDPTLFGAPIPIRGAVGDQQAAMFGQCCFESGDCKLTIGTGAFLDINVGSRPHTSVAGFYPLIAWKMGDHVAHIAEGASNTAGNGIDWLKTVGLLGGVSELDGMLEESKAGSGVYFVPAFNGVQAPINDSTACGSMMGITQDTKSCDVTRAVLESLAFRNKQLFESMTSEISLPINRFVCDGGVSVNSFVMQLTSDLIGLSIARPRKTEMSALGAAFFAGLAVGYWSSKDELKSLIEEQDEFQPDRQVAQRYEPIMKQWCKAVKRSLHWY